MVVVVTLVHRMHPSCGFLLALVAVVNADVYFHSPRGSNNRLNEASANRANANRLFDSQNNNRGGYNAGDAGANRAGNEEQQYRMKYYASSLAGQSSTHGSGQSYLTLEWTNQHGCGGNEDSDPHKQNCNIVLQYMCQTDDAASATGLKTEDYFRNGANTHRQDYQAPNNNENKNQATQRRNNKVDIKRGYQEPYSWYDKCLVRERNKGLFTADQNLKNNNGLGVSGAIYTRQNPNGNRNGYECPEERDYYPYWHPTPWKDIAVLAENATICEHYKSKSFNVQPYHECVEWWDNAKTQRKHYSAYNNKAECTADSSREWVAFHNFLEIDESVNSEAQCVQKMADGLTYIWAIPHNSPDAKTKQCLVALPELDCQEAPWSRSNHLGNSREGVASNYTWTLPFFPSLEEKRCVLRIRYNISTDDYDPYNTDSRHNEDLPKSVMSPVQQNPYVEIGAGQSPLRLAINTAQFGRTFQDRSHVFIIHPRPDNTEQSRIYNLNVRGKRGNIVQVYPAVEYDFHPNTLAIQQGDLVHVQWTGSNSHNNGNPAGDGQAGDAGEGTGGTDRNNLVQIADLSENYPLPIESTTMWQDAEVLFIHHGHLAVKPEDLAISMATSGYYMCVSAAECPTPAESAETKKNGSPLNNLLNNAPASYEGALVRFRRGVYHYICSRNNNFTNRSQKGTLIVQ